MILSAADSFCNCVTFGILGTFQTVYKGSKWWGGLLAGCWLWFVKQMCTKKRKKKTPKQKQEESKYTDGKPQTYSMELTDPNKQEVLEQ